jgi:hypothetical protein
MRSEAIRFYTDDTAKHMVMYFRRSDYGEQENFFSQVIPELMQWINKLVRFYARLFGFSDKMLHKHTFKLYAISSEGFACVSKWKSNICDKLKIETAHMFSVMLSKVLTGYMGLIRIEHSQRK